MPDFLRRRKLLQLAQSARAPARQHRQQAQISLLQSFVRVHKRFDVLLVRQKQTGLAVLCAARFPPQFLKMKCNSLLRSLDCSLQGRIEFFDLFSQPHQHLVRLLFVALKTLRQRLRYYGAFHLMPHLL